MSFYGPGARRGEYNRPAKKGETKKTAVGPAREEREEKAKRGFPRLAMVVSTAPATLVVEHQ